MEADQDAFRKALVRSVSACCDLEDKAQQSAATTSMTKLAEAMILNAARGENACYAELESMLVMMTTDNGAGPGDPQFLEMKINIERCLMNGNLSQMKGSVSLKEAMAMLPFAQKQLAWNHAACAIDEHIARTQGIVTVMAKVADVAQKGSSTPDALRIIVADCGNIRNMMQRWKLDELLPYIKKVF